MANAFWDWEEVFDSINNNLVITDGNGIVLYTNNAVKEVYSKTREEIIGRSVEDLEREKVFNPSITKKVLKEKTKQSLIQETQNGHKLLITANPIFDSKGNIRLVVSYSHDVTELFRLKEYITYMEEEMKKVRDELEELRNHKTGEEGIVACSPAMKHVLSSAKKIADVDVTVLLTGESGAGKNVIARYIHNYSKRRNAPLVEINCGSIPETLLESELFGYTAGSFSGANQQGKKGLVEAAEGGTLFLDEIGELPLNLQVKLLTLIQEKKFYPVGGTKPRQVDFRLIAATNADLKQMVQAGKFRQDLYFRLSVVPIHIPPLRERHDDLFALLMEFTKRFNDMYQREMRFHQQSIDQLLHYSWPGNVRELENMVERLVLTVDGPVIGPEDLPMHINSEWPPTLDEGRTLQEMIDEFEATLIKKAFLKCKSTTKMAEYLGISQPTAVRKLQKHKNHIQNREP